MFMGFSRQEYWSLNAKVQDVDVIAQMAGSHEKLQKQGHKALSVLPGDNFPSPNPWSGITGQFLCRTYFLILYKGRGIVSAQLET